MIIPGRAGCNAFQGKQIRSTKTGHVEPRKRKLNRYEYKKMGLYKKLGLVQNPSQQAPGQPLKEIAKAYDITYPTVRLRLDRLIEKIKILDSNQLISRFERLTRSLYAERKIDINTLKTLLTAHKNEMETQNETSDDNS